MHFRKNQGSIFIIVICVVFVLLFIGVAFLFWIRMESRNATNKRVSTRDVFYAEGATEKVVQRLQTDGAWAQQFTDGTLAAPTVGTIIIDGIPVQVSIEEIR